MDLSYFDAISVWLEQNNDWLGLVICLVAMLESLVAVGLLIPGVAMLFALGAIAGTGALDIYATLSWAIAGAIVGDGVSFWLGYKYHNKLRNLWPFKQYPHWLEKGESFFHTYGVLSVVIGRFVGPVRPLIPVVAGMMDMRPLTFYGVNVLSALGWAPVYLLPGFFTGAALSTEGLFPEQLFYLLGSIVILATLLPALFFWYQQRFAYTYWLCAALCLLGFLSLLSLYLLNAETELNNWAMDWFEPLKALDWWVPLMSRWTWLGAVPVLGVLLAVVMIWSYRQGTLKGFIPLIWTVPAMVGSVWLFKWLVDNPRPTTMPDQDPFSFPSGHTTLAAFFICWMAAQLGSRLSIRKRAGLQMMALLLVSLVALSRLSLGVHWLGDVLAGVCLGLFWMLLARQATHSKSMP